MTEDEGVYLNVAVEETAEFLRRHLKALESSTNEQLEQVREQAELSAADLEAEVERLASRIESLVQVAGTRIEGLVQRVSDLKAEAERARALDAERADKLERAEAKHARDKKRIAKLSADLASVKAQADAARRMAMTPTELQRALLRAIAGHERVWVYRIDALDGAASDFLAVSPTYLGQFFEGRNESSRQRPYLFNGRALHDGVLEEILGSLGVVADPAFAHGAVAGTRRRMLLLRAEPLSAVLELLGIKLKALRGGLTLHTERAPEAGLGRGYGDGPPAADDDDIPF